MFNAIRMDIYRLFHTKFTYIILIIMIAFSVMGTGFLSVLIKENERNSEAAVQQEQVVDGNSSDLSEEQALILSITDPKTGKPSVLNQAMSDFSGLTNALFVAIFTILFVTADIKSGFIKSIGGQVKSRWVLLFSKMAALFIFTVIVILTEFLVQLIAVNIFFEDVVVGNASDIFALCGSQFVLHFSFALFIMALAIIIKNNVVSMIIAVTACTGIFSIIFMGFNYIIHHIGLKEFDINNYMISQKITEVTIGASTVDIRNALLVAAAYIVISAVAVYNVFKRRDI